MIHIIAVCKDSYVVYACGLTETENDVAKMTLQNDVAALATQADGIIFPNKPLIEWLFREW